MPSPASMLYRNTFVVIVIATTAVLLLAVESKGSGLVFQTIESTVFEACLIKKGFPLKSLIFRENKSTRSNYDSLNYQWNKYYGEKRPLAYVLPRKVEEVQLSVICAGKAGLRVVAKSGGHSYTKYSFGDSDAVVVDLQRMNRVKIESGKRSAEVGSGVLSGSLSSQLLSAGFLVPNGLCPSVGISYALGGGYSFLSRRYGLTMDNLVEMDMVDARGSLLTANSTMNSDLFWALRGGGAGGSFGFVTRYKFKLHPIPPRVIYGKNVYSISIFSQVFDAFQNYANSAPPKSINFIMTTNQTTILVEVVEVLDQGSSSANVQKILSTTFPTAKSSIVRSLEFNDYLLTVGAYGNSAGNFANVTRHDYGPFYFKGTSFFVKNLIGSNAIRELNSLIQRLTKYIVIEWQCNGGVLRDIGPRDTAYVHRGQNLYKVGPDFLAPVDRKPKDELDSVNWLREFFVTTKSILKHTESYQNNQDEEMEDYLERYYGENLPRLKKIKRKYDRHNFFQYPQSIPLF
jgi:hypothetical protein